MLRFLTIFFIISSLFSLAPGHHPIMNALIDYKEPDYHFGEQVVFRANLQSDVPIVEAFLSYQSEGKTVQVVEIKNAVSGEISYTLDLHQEVLRPFANVTYWFQVKPKDGEVVTSPHYTFFYEDNRFTWQKLENDPFVVHWVDGNLSFAQEVLNAAQAGLEEIQNLIPVTPPTKPIDIYVYSRVEDLQSAQDLSNISWVAGNASPDLGVVMVSIAPGTDQRLVMDQQVPHELAHVLTYQITGSGYAKLPAWLTEGIASMSELYPNSDYTYTLEVAKRDNAFIPMQELCNGFPRDASRAFLAYAQADSFSHYLQTNYGLPGMQKLIQKYLDGLGCSEGIQAALGSPLNVLEYKWKQDSLKANTAGLVLNNLMPYLVLIALIITVPLFSLVLIRHRSK
jgi:hypothetical protein